MSLPYHLKTDATDPHPLGSVPPQTKDRATQALTRIRKQFVAVGQIRSAGLMKDVELMSTPIIISFNEAIAIERCLNQVGLRHAPAETVVALPEINGLTLNISN
jgi:hypothetical protein